MYIPRKTAAVATLVALLAVFTFSTTAARTNGRDTITAQDLKEWLGYLSSDELEGRATFTEGLGIDWPGDALSLLVILSVFLAVSWASVRLLRWLLPLGAKVAAKNV